MTLTRRDGARRLLDEAIRLWLDARDPLAVHALTMAAFGVLRDLHQHENEGEHLRLKDLLSEIGSSRLVELWNKLKHADRDPEVPLSVPSEKENEWRMGMALVIYRTLERDLTPEMGAFHLMSLSAYPDNFQVVADEDPDIEHGAQVAAALMREDVELRRTIVRSFLKLIVDGSLPANVNLRRRHRNDYSS
ncbi:MAG: hypothetical protein HEQ16_04635 [Bosea sp.]|nr:hypothetical protein [Bosea sp. (in: a-proteobacteria)]